MTDLVIVGAGIGGGALATVLARAGLEVLALERSREYEDRVRGEWIAPWGVAELRALGLYAEIRTAGGHHLARHVTYDETLDPDAAEARTLPLGIFHPDVPGPLCIGHPHLSQTLCDLASAAGARVLRGVERVRVQAGGAPRVEYSLDGATYTERCRLVVGADGRASSVRRQLGLELREDAPHHLFTGLLVEDAAGWPEDLQAIGTEGDLAFLAFPQGKGRVRIYGGFALEQKGRFAGPDGPERLLRSFDLACCPASRHLAAARPAGPCLSYPNHDTWMDTPCVPGAVLLGDAAGYNDPVIGQGLSITLRDARILRDLLCEGSPWDVALFAPYAEERRERMRRLRFAAAITSALDCEFDAAARARRARYLERLAGDPTLALALAAVMAGPEQFPEETFSEATRNRILEG